MQRVRKLAAAGAPETASLVHAVLWQSLWQAGLPAHLPELEGVDRSLARMVRIFLDCAPGVGLELLADIVARSSLHASWRQAS